MLRLTTYFLLILFAFSVFKSAAPLVDYAWNYDFISNELCIEREIEESTCDGMCYLKIELTSTQETEQPVETVPSYRLSEIPMVPSPSLYFQIEDFVNETEKAQDLYLNHFKGLIPSPNTPPPRA